MRIVEALSGGCLCEAVQYRITLPLLDAGYCHCRLCQKSSGAPVLVWLTVPVQGFSYTKGVPVTFRSSSYSQREFCGGCGTQLVFRKSSMPKTVDVTVASLADPSRVAPEYHIWRHSRIGWFDTADWLPRHDDNGPDNHEA
ncbi:MAG TPA: GFA family protein [Burkholderiales bacterium]|nr:GFA family protein [Burkholderiales bacterium]